LAELRKMTGADRFVDIDPPFTGRP